MNTIFPVPATTEELPNVVEAFLRLLEAKDFRLRRHSERVAQLVEKVTAHLQFSDEERAQLRFGALLHDIGNIGIPDTILLKPGGLTDIELDEVKLHPIIGEHVVSSLKNCDNLRPFIRSHHEKLDGSGYPDGLTEKQIPYSVCVLAVADVYDSLRSERAYRAAFSHQEALAILQKEAASGWWNASVVQALAQNKIADNEFAPT